MGKDKSKGQIELVKELISYLKNAYVNLDLKEEKPLTAEELKQFKRDYPRWPSPFHTPKLKADDREKYFHFVPKILDFFVFNTLDLALVTISAQKPDAFNISIAKAAIDATEELGANGLARYLGPTHFPDFIPNENFFKKMLWLEWALFRLLNLYFKGDLKDETVFGTSIKETIYAYYQSTLEYTKRYQNFSPKVDGMVFQFRKHFTADNLADSFNSALAAFKPEAIAPEKIEPVITIKAEEKHPEEKLRNPMLQTEAPKPSILISVNPVADNDQQHTWNKFVYQVEDTKPSRTSSLTSDTPDLENELVKLRYAALPLLNRDSSFNEDRETRKLRLLKEAACEYQMYLEQILEENNFKYTSKDMAIFKLRTTKQLISAESVKHFEFIYKGAKPVLLQSRDTGTATFLKAVATLFSGFFAIPFGLWSTKSKKTTTKIDKLLQPGCRL